jgi:microcystin-dependent protein
MEPAGIIMPFAGTVAPENYLFCDGSAVSRSTYATLFDVIGTTFGAGDGSTTFNLPDLSGRVPLGVSSTHLLGSMGGSETVTLTESELPAHVHKVPQHGHEDTIEATTPAFSHTITQPVFKYNKPNTGGNAGSGGTGASYNSTNTATATRSRNLSVGDHAAAACTVGGSVTNADAFDTGSNGNNDAHNNMQPFLTMSYIICTGD